MGGVYSGVLVTGLASPCSSPRQRFALEHGDGLVDPDCDHVRELQIGSMAAAAAATASSCCLCGNTRVDLGCPRCHDVATPLRSKRGRELGGDCGDDLLLAASSSVQRPDDCCPACPRGAAVVVADDGSEDELAERAMLAQDGGEPKPQALPSAVHFHFNF